MAFEEDLSEFFEVDQGFAELANITRKQGLNLNGITAIVDRDVDVVSDNGLAITRRTVVTLIKSEVAQIDEGDELTLAGSNESFTLMEPLSDDGAVLQVYARPVIHG